MSWIGHYVFGDTEIINVDRTEKYLAAVAARHIRPVYNNHDLHKVLGDRAYRSPLQDDDCPWTDPDEPDSYGFWGAYPQDVVGIDGSTRTAVISENTGFGGVPGALRQGTRQIVFTVLLIGESDAAVHYGLTWLDSALLTGSQGTCDDDSCSGTTMCYLASEPWYDPDLPLVYPPWSGGGSVIIGQGIEPAGVNQCLEDLQRFLYRCTCTNGPIVNSKQTLPDGTVFWNVTFTITAGIPFPFGNEVPIVQAAFDGHQHDHLELPGYVTNEVGCQSKTWQPVFDPACPDLILPPTLPTVRLGCYDAPKNWRRYILHIPKGRVRAWSDMVPLIVVRTDAQTVRNMRIRLYADPHGSFDPEDKPCGFCADMLISYVPSHGALVIDGRDQTIQFVTPGQSRHATGLVFASDRTPMDWPALSCGTAYVATIDFEQQQDKPELDFSLIPRRR